MTQMDEPQVEALTNWGRWGPEDEQGSLNLITPDLIKVAAGLIKIGKSYSLSAPLETDGPQLPPRPKILKVMLHHVEPTGRGGSGDALMMHSHSGTHIDALCHFWYGDQLYNGYNAQKNITSMGASRNAIDKAPFLIGRVVLLDIAAWKGVEYLQAGEPISAADLDACAAAQGIALRPGDLLLLRTGWMRLFYEDRALFDSGEPGIDVSTLPWLKAHDIVAVGVDNHAVEVLAQIPPKDLPVHRVAIRDLGIYLLENLDLEALAADGAYESFLVVAPLRLTGAAGSPVNPIAIT